ncbi:LysE family translocator [Guptibacillus hwajinpoensis]|uniref:LysE family translocator n=1 Tax=Guptibacillus hwajinpoensis TaxID=208199 RepID=UPI00273F0F89|nr:LysE family transporter [Pseudalkalibacillus hwajinpoensis]WLR59348.1 LysE family transporter [Pseudalkalibacillus hwajinpoensis]
MLEIAIAHIILGLSIAAPLGPINIEIMKRGIHKGFWSSLFVGAGGMSADLVLMYLMYFGIATFVKLTIVQISLMILGAIILTISGIQGFRSQVSLDEDEDKEKSGLFHSYATGFMIAAFNPMNLLFWLGIYGSVLSVSLQQPDKWQALFLICTRFHWDWPLECQSLYDRPLRKITNETSNAPLD